MGYHLIDGQARIMAMAEYAAAAYARSLRAAPANFHGHFVGTTGTSRCAANNIKNKERAFRKRVAKRRAKKGYS
jgi:hypothetical protein